MSALGLGTANWGASYGAPGLQARVDGAAAAQLAREFLAAGHDLVDTAPAYGEAEALVGSVFDGQVRVVSKVGLGDGERVVGDCLDSVQRSCRRTGVERLAGVLLHDPTAAVTSPELARRVVDAVRDAGLARRVGVSVYSPEEALAAVDVLGADLLQVPCNLLDQRFVTSSCLAELADRGVEVHVRSVFLNGVVLADPASLAEPLRGLRAPVERLREVAGAHGLTPLELAVGFARQLTDVAAVVCGAVEAAQLREVLDAWAAPVLDADRELDALAVENVTVDPRTWSR